MRSLLGTRSVWLNLEPVATSILLSSSDGCDEGLQHLLRLWLRFGRRNRESQHITLCLTLSMSISLCLPTYICLSLSVASTYAHKLAARHSLRFLWKPQTSPFTHPTLIAPLRLTCACTHARTYIRVHTHIVKTLFIWRNWKEAFLISSPALSCNGVNRISMWNCVHVCAVDPLI